MNLGLRQHQANTDNALQRQMDHGLRQHQAVHMLQGRRNKKRKKKTAPEIPKNLRVDIAKILGVAIPANRGISPRVYIGILQTLRISRWDRIPTGIFRLYPRQISLDTHCRTYRQIPGDGPITSLMRFVPNLGQVFQRSDCQRLHHRGLHEVTCRRRRSSALAA
jgi:hypothetical protein